MFVLGEFVPNPEAIVALNALDIVERGYVWQLLTSVVFHSPRVPLSFAFNLLWIYFIGRQLEDAIGTKRLLQGYAWSAGAAVLLTLMVQLVGHYLVLGTSWTQLWGTLPLGAAGPALGLVGIWVGRLGNQMVHLAFIGPMQARTIGILVAAFELLMMLTGSSMNAGMRIAGLAMGYAIGRGWWPPNPQRRQLLREKKKIEKELSKFQVIEGGRAGEPAGPRTRRRGWTGNLGNDGDTTVH